jgi:diguanylate cyclase (GGDEF)-like protein
MTGMDDEQRSDEPPAIDDAFLARMVNAAFHPYVILAPDGTIRFVSDSVVELLGAPAAHYLGRNMIEFVDPATRARTVDAFLEFTAPRSSDTGWVGPALTVNLQHLDGHLVHCRALAVPSGDPRFDGLILQIRASESNDKLDAAISSMVSSDDLETTMRSILDFATEQMPYSIGVVGLGYDGHRFRSIVADPRAPRYGDTPLPLDSTPSPWRAVLEGTDVVMMDASDMAHQVGTLAEQTGLPAGWAHSLGRSPREQDVLLFWRRAPGSPGPHIAEAVERIKRLIRLAIEADRSRRLLQQQASTDDLTGLANRSVLFDRFEQLGAERPDRTFGILYLDLDDFKEVNDQCGHSTGDRVLQIAASRIERNVRTGDVVARLGGDEFAALCVTTTRHELEQMARRLVEAFEVPIVVDGRSFELGLSVGVAVHEPDGEHAEPEQLLDQADKAMLRAKSLGKHRWQFADAS